MTNIETTNKKYFKSIKEYADNPDRLENSFNEFSKGITDEFNPDEMNDISRRKFLALLTASAAFTLASCSDYKSKGEIVPYNQKPEEVTPGIANFYASTCSGCSNSCGILIKTREGRPIKVDGNPEHPINQGKICVKGQASVLNLYDPDRLTTPIRKDLRFINTSWADADKKIVDALNLASKTKKEIAVITHKIVSPTTQKVLNDFKNKYSTTKIYSYDLFNDGNRNNAWKKTYNQDSFPVILWDKAKIILSLESDILSTEGNAMEQTRAFTSNRDVMNKNDFNRLYVIESVMSETGMSADHRLRLRPDAQFEFVMSLINEVSNKLPSNNLDNELQESLKTYSLSEFINQYNLSPKIINNLIKDLIGNKGKSIVHAGSTLNENVHTAVNLLNEILENIPLYSDTEENISYSQYTEKAEWEELIEKMNAGNVGVVIHFDTNPVYHLPEDYGYEQALKYVFMDVTLTEKENETSNKSKYVLPIHHNFESWGDFKTRTGLYSLQQPVINPLYDTRQKESILLRWINGKSESYKEDIYHKYLLKRLQSEVYPLLNYNKGFQEFLYTALNDGVFIYNEKISRRSNFNSSSLKNIKKENINNDYLIVFKESNAIGDGKFSNNGWLQELPHPVSKVVWDNYAAISNQTAKNLKVENDDVIEISIENRKQKLPVFIQPGMADNVVAVELGYGRKNSGTVANDIGVNSILLMSKNSDFSKWIYKNVKINPTGDTYELVTTQEHHSIDKTYMKDLPKKRGVIRELDYSEYKKNPENIIAKEHLENIVKPPQFKENKWGMAIDLNKCTGCNACVMACNVENNIPVVGKEQVKKNREMHWIRIDRYYSDSVEEPTVINQPMMCQHCDNAPCEPVCPVAATNHSPDGINQMVYNRCVGTRYCSNNCPYKVRRFNFFDFRDHFAKGYYNQEPVELVNNPEVTVRSRGLMEKCTFCIQRVMEARQEAIKDGRLLEANEIKTACQQACPSNAIVFGDLNNSQSDVSKKHKHPLNYSVLGELNTKPGVTYITKLRNTSQEGEA